MLATTVSSPFLFTTQTRKSIPWIPKRGSATHKVCWFSHTFSLACVILCATSTPTTSFSEAFQSARLIRNLHRVSQRILFVLRCIAFGSVARRSDFCGFMSKYPVFFFTQVDYSDTKRALFFFLQCRLSSWNSTPNSFSTFFLSPKRPSIPLLRHRFGALGYMKFFEGLFWSILGVGVGAIGRSRRGQEGCLSGYCRWAVHRRIRPEQNCKGCLVCEHCGDTLAEGRANALRVSLVNFVAPPGAGVGSGSYGSAIVGCHGQEHISWFFDGFVGRFPAGWGGNSAPQIIEINLSKIHCKHFLLEKINNLKKNFLFLKILQTEFFNFPMISKRIQHRRFHIISE